MKKLLLALLFCTHQLSADIWGTSKNLFFNYWPHLIYINAMISSSYLANNYKTILQTKCTKVEHKKLLDFINTFNKDTNLNLYYGLPIHFYTVDALALALGNEDILIIPEYYDLICKTLEKDKLGDNDIVILNIFKFIILHEIGHLKDNILPKLVLMNRSACIINMILFELSKRLYNFKYSKVTTYLLLNTVSNYVLGLFLKSEEFKADDNAQDIDSMKGGISFFNNIIKLMEKDSLKKLQIMADLNHPAPKDRLIRIENRLKALQAMAA